MYKIDLLRHGQTTLSHTLRGSTDDALTELGWQQMHDTVDQSLLGQSRPQWDVIFSSPLQRCDLFAVKIANQYSLPVIRDEKLQEMYFGDWEGIPTQTIYEQSAELLAKFWEKPMLHTPPNAERLEFFAERVEKALVNIQNHMQIHQYNHALVVTHGGVIKLLKCWAQQQDLNDILKMTAELGQLNRFELNDDLSLRLLEQTA